MENNLLKEEYGNKIIYEMKDETAFNTFRKGIKDNRVWQMFPESQKIANDIKKLYLNQGKIIRDKVIIIKHGSKEFPINNI